MNTETNFTASSLPLKIGETTTKKLICSLSESSIYNGISVSRKNKMILLFSNMEEAEKYGYGDSRQNDGTFIYAGQGILGDQTVEKGLNKSLLNHKSTGMTVHFFLKTDLSYEYRGEVEVFSHYFTRALDRSGNFRRQVLFNLRLVTKI